MEEHVRQDTRGVSRRRFLSGGAAVAVGALLSSRLHMDTAHAESPLTLPSPVKKRATYYTDARITGARQNIANYAWAQEIRDAAVAKAAPLVAAGPEFAWRSLTTQGLPRSIAVNQVLGSPITGTDIFQYGAYGWRADPFNAPWKLTDPSSGYVFPSNDFASFYASALDEHGNFDRSLGDPQFLENVLYPERGPGWGVEDGYGWIDDDGNKWTFAAYYNEWWIWGNDDYSGGGGSLVCSRLEAVRDAYLYTGDTKYAHIGLIMLDRIADVYPAMDISAYRREDGYIPSDGHRGKGKVVGDIWEAISLAPTIVSYYDAFYPAIADTDEADVVEFLSQKSMAYGLGTKDTTDAIRANIESGIIRQIYPAVKQAQILGNFGSHQAALALAAVVLDEPSATTEWLDFVFAPGTLLSSPDWHLTGGDVEPTLVDQVDRDGWGFESSPGYNLIWKDQMESLADILNGYDGYPSADLYNNPKYESMVRAVPSLTMLNAYTPAIGDSGQTGKPHLIGTTDGYVAAFERYGTPIYAQAAYLANGSSVEGLRSGIFAEDAAGTQSRIEQIIATQGPLHLPSDHETGYGFAALRDGSSESMRGLVLYHGRNWGHGHADSLYVELYGFGLNLSPSLGYPEFADGRARQVEWNNNTVAANTVVVDASTQANKVVGQPRNFFSTEDVQLIDVDASSAYPQTSVYRRSVAIIRVDDSNSYAVDLFQVRGGSEHLFSFHGAEGPASIEGVSLSAQTGGSYAGPDVVAPPDSALPRPGASGFDWLVNVERGTPAGPFAVDWQIRDTYGVNDPALPIHLRATMLNQVDELALADGIPPRNKAGNPPSLRYMLAKRTADGTNTDLVTNFLSVLEPYNGSRLISEIIKVNVQPAEDGVDFDPDDAAAVKVVHHSGRVDYIVFNSRPEVQLHVDDAMVFSGAFALLEERDGQPVLAVSSEGTQMVPLKASGSKLVSAMKAERGAIHGTVADFSRELSIDSWVSITLSEPISDDDLARTNGAYIYVDNDGVRNAAYAITGVSLVSPTEVKLSIRGTTVRELIDDTNLESGYTYDLSVGATARIPLVRQWTV